MKAKFTANDGGSVTISYDDNNIGERVEYTFHTGRAEGLSYVYHEDGKQVCENLSSNGPTLMAFRDSLIGTIRKEYRKMLANDKKQIY